MDSRLLVYNTLSGRKEAFEPLAPPFAGMYVCGPTVYGDAHLGHARPAITFDVVFRYLRHLGYKVRYVRNITDVGHLENDADQGEDKIGKRARLEQIEPMEVVQKFTSRYHSDMEKLNVLSPAIEPRASGHIIEQIEMIRRIMANGFAYEVNGSVYFDVKKYSAAHRYGALSGRVPEELLSETRALSGQDEKHFHGDFALWVRAKPEHIMRWPSPWSDGFPGWHLECSSMSAKYLGDHFDIHGGGMDLLYPHHENEIAQSVACTGKTPVKYWMHNNMVTVNGRKMGKSLSNFITLGQFFTGDHELLDQGYDPMTIRFFMLQAHYRSTLDFSNEALKAAEKGLKKLMNALALLPGLPAQGGKGASSGIDAAALEKRMNDAMNDDFNTPVVLSHVFEAVHCINSVNDGKTSITEGDRDRLTKLLRTVTGDMLGLTQPAVAATSNGLAEGVMDILLDLRKRARESKDFETADRIRGQLEKLHITIKDTKDGATWSHEG